MSPSAVDELAGASRAEHAAKHPIHKYPNPATRGVDVDTLMLDVIRSRKLDIDVGASIVSGKMTRTMAGASTIEFTISDHRRKLLHSDIWEHAIDIRLNGHFFRLAQVAKQGNDLTLTFEDRIVAYLRHHDSHEKISRDKMTRAEFIGMLAKRVDAAHIRYYCPEIHGKQPVAKRKKTEAERRDRKEPGLLLSTKIRITPVIPTSEIVSGTHGPQGLPGPSSFTFKAGGKSIGPYATRKQLKVAEEALDEGYRQGANLKVLVTGMMVAIQESKLDPKATNGVHVGIFQQDPRYWPATRNVTKDAKAFFEALIKADKAKPNMAYGDLANSVQNAGPTYPGEIAQWVWTAKRIVEEYGATGGSTDREVVKKYQYTVGPPDGKKDENFWDAMLRLADQVRWRIFVNGNTLYYVADRDLISQKPIMKVSEDTEGVDSIDFDWDTNKRNNEATITCDADRWFAPPGSVIVLENCGPASEGNGRWLVWEVERDIFSRDTTITLKKPEKPKREPAPDIVSQARNAGDDSIIVAGRIRGMKHIRDRIVAAAYRGLKENQRLYYNQYRPIPRSLWTNNHGNQLWTDCSGFAILCYKAAGAADPSGNNYNGQGYTGSMMSTGTRTANPQPGDLVFYRSPEHVGVIVEDGYVIEFGGEPGPKRVPVNYRSDIIGYYRYDLHDESQTDPPPPTTPISAPTGRNNPATR